MHIHARTHIELWKDHDTTLWSQLMLIQTHWHQSSRTHTHTHTHTHSLLAVLHYENRKSPSCIYIPTCSGASRITSHDKTPQIETVSRLILLSRNISIFYAPYLLAKTKLKLNFRRIQKNPTSPLLSSLQCHSSEPHHGAQPDCTNTDGPIAFAGQLRDMRQRLVCYVPQNL